ncbi:MAG: methionyl-tRNA formyltransferase [Acidimicrobiales bacterium]|jgi:methionyl-tRNA formyltransferase
MRLVFLGTPEAAVPTLEAVIDAGHEVVLVVTRPDRRRGRGSQLSPSPVKEVALRHGLAVTHRLADVADVDAQRGVVVAYGAIIPESLLHKLPMLNVHFSLLPRWRGAAPVQRAVLAGDVETGVAIISLEASLDTGPVHLERRIPVGDDSAEDLTRRLAVLGAGALVEVLASPDLLDHPTPQSGETTYAEKLSAETFRLHPAMSSDLAWRTVRLGHAYFSFGPKRIGVVAAHPTFVAPSPGELFQENAEIVLGVSDGGVVMTSVRPEGGKTMDARSWWSGLRPAEERRAWT